MPDSILVLKIFIAIRYFVVWRHGLGMPTTVHLWKSEDILRSPALETPHNDVSYDLSFVSASFHIACFKVRGHWTVCQSLFRFEGWTVCHCLVLMPIPLHGLSDLLLPLGVRTSCSEHLCPSIRLSLDFQFF